MKLIPISFCVGFVLVHLLGCSAAPAPSSCDGGVADPQKYVRICDVDCQTGGLNGWWDVPPSCDPAAQPNPSAPDWFMNCQGLRYTPYAGGVYACTFPQNVCQ
jgi:hypothetical protein